MPDFATNGHSEKTISPAPKVRFHNFEIQSIEDYHKLYKVSVDNPDIFWKQIANEFAWKTKPNKNCCSYNFDPTKSPVQIKWMEGGETNVCYNALDMNVLNGLGNKIAFYWEGNDIHERKSVTYRQLLKMVCKFANVLKDKGVKKEIESPSTCP
ncbi:acetyl-coenzyme A synthetase [Caerostris darwini]|uniref:Acetyl-coenzyme A synthetase n=1 Tax=Caerostris darwini TaxID=1538125 RepID=A0AAV4MK96_9ARAC|nr:acetyl-coenzyme A synthetase [Caerostris darwini]